jgi:hypothetical protein
MGKPLSPEHKAAISEGKREAFRRRQDSVDRPDKKKCTRCGKWKKLDWEDFSKSEFLMRKQNLASGVVGIYPSGECRSCSAERSAAWRENERAAGRLSGRQRKWTRTKFRKNPRRFRARQREYQAALRRKKGMKPGLPWKCYREQGLGGEIPAEPLSNWLKMMLKDLGISIEEMASTLEMDPGHLRRIVNLVGENGKPLINVKVATADRIFVAFDRPDVMAVLYPK